MARGRGSASLIIIVAAALFLSTMTVHCSAAKYRVGDALGWRFLVQSWPQGKSFKAGDLLEFNYLPLFHNVVEVDKNGYDSCKAPDKAKVYHTGSDEIILNRGDNFFICTYSGHCQLGMKIAVTAA